MRHGQPGIPSGAHNLEATFDPRRNSLNALRLALALLVVVSHCKSISGRGPDFRLGGTTLGTWAVFGFFIISGFLITRSRERRTPGRYLWDRFLRIYPGYLAAMLAVAFVAAPASTLLTGRGYRVGDGVSYLLHNLSLAAPLVSQPSIGATLVDVTWQEWNGPAWTLFYEALCYLMVAALFGLAGPAARRRVALGAVVVLTPLAFLVGRMPPSSGSDIVSDFVMLTLAFSVGTAGYLYRDQVPMGGRVSALAFAVLVGVAAAGWSPLLSLVPFGVLLFWLSDRLPLDRVGSRFDVSYGVYIYAWPLQTLLVLTFARYAVGAPLWVFTLASVVLVLPIAWASCVLVERPAQRLRPAFSSTRPAQVRAAPLA